MRLVCGNTVDRGGSLRIRLWTSISSDLTSPEFMLTRTFDCPCLGSLLNACISIATSFLQYLDYWSQ